MLASCANERDILPPIDNELGSEIKFRGDIPKNHPFYNVIYKNINTYTLDDVDRAYREHIFNEIKRDYTNNLKNDVFAILMSKELATKGSPDQKKFYIDEMMSLDTNLPNLLQFYYLLTSCKGYISKTDMKDIADRFYDKNKNVIETSYFPNEKNKKNTALLLESAYGDFLSRYVFFIK